MMTMEQVRRSFAMQAAILKPGARRPPPLKDVTRRDGWGFLQPGDLLSACEKCQGLGKGGKIVVMGAIQVVSVRKEPLRLLLEDSIYGMEECRREGFPEMSPASFCNFFIGGHKGVLLGTPLTRIEFKYIGKEA